MGTFPAVLVAATQGNSPALMVFVIALTGGICVLLGLLLRKLAARSDKRAAAKVDRALERALQDLEGEKARLGNGFDSGPEVRIEIYTFSGFLLWTTEVKHSFALPSERGRILLRRIHWHNVRNGLLAHGGFLIPFISWINTIQQRRSIRKQLRQRERLN